jgi:hypothetical protein
VSHNISRTYDQAVLAAWQDELKATDDASIRQQCLQQESELLPHFAEHYQQLKALRRKVRRNLQRQWKRSLAGIALLFVLGQAPAFAATINVGGACTPARAIVSANNDASPRGFCRPGRGADTVVLPPHRVQTLRVVNNTNYGPTGLPTIRSVITIDGNGSTVTRAKPAPDFRIFAVVSTGELKLQETVVSGAKAAHVDAGSRGGGILNYGTVSITNSTISHDFAFYGAGIQNTSGTVTVDNSTISGNLGNAGCGIRNYYQGDVAINNSTISGNNASGYGGGIRNDAGNVTITNSTISGNVAFGAAGVFNTAFHGGGNSTDQQL